MALGHDDVDTALNVALRVLGAAGQRGHRDASLVGLVDDVGGR